MLLTTRAFPLLCLVQLCLAREICSPQGCTEGSPASPLLATLGSTAYLPGTYSSLPPSIRLSANDSQSGSTLAAPAYPVAFSSRFYSGAESAWTDARPKNGWSSLYLPDGWYTSVGGGQAVWGAIPDMGEFSGIDARDLNQPALSTCSPSCSSYGTCTPSNSSAPSCACQTGWSGSACDACASGYYGLNCTGCPAGCGKCDDGLSGTGACLSPQSSASTCNCAHGTCTATGDCICAAGFITPSSGDQKCATCAVGFFQTATGDCQACPLGCMSCQLQPGTNDTATCTSCSASLQLSVVAPKQCSSVAGTCGQGQYWDAVGGNCKACSPACSTCTGPNTSDCLACASPRSNLNGTCVGFDVSTGICDSSLSGISGTFVVNNGQSRCDACPAGCLTCSIPSFSSVASYSNLQCQSCHEGRLLQGGRCVQECEAGYFFPATAASGINGTCQGLFGFFNLEMLSSSPAACDASCSTCAGSATFCTACKSGLASVGTCVSTCPAGTLNTNGTCASCHPDCSTCLAPGSASACTSCPAARPVLSSGMCLDHCPNDQYYDSSSATCRPCDKSCASCVAYGSSACSSCADGLVLRSGTCQPTSCGTGGFANGFGVCLSAFATGSSSSRLAPLAALVLVLIAAGAAVWWYVRREHRRTRQATAEFALTLEDRTRSPSPPGPESMRHRLLASRLGAVVGLDRLREPGWARRRDQAGLGRSATVYEGKEKSKFKEMWLSRSKSRGRSRDEGVEMLGQGKGEREAKRAWARARDSTMSWSGGGEGGGGDAPPPYVPPVAGPNADTATFNGDQKADPLSTDGAVRPDAVLVPTRENPGFIPKHKIHHLSTASSSDPSPTRLKPAPRPTARPRADQDGTAGRPVIRAGSADLKTLWPNMTGRSGASAAADAVDLLGEEPKWEDRKYQHGWV